jgi:hypothetical protein
MHDLPPVGTPVLAPSISLGSNAKEPAGRGGGGATLLVNVKIELRSMAGPHMRDVIGALLPAACAGAGAEQLVPSRGQR